MSICKQLQGCGFIPIEQPYKVNEVSISLQAYHEHELEYYKQKEREQGDARLLHPRKVSRWC